MSINTIAAFLAKNKRFISDFTNGETDTNPDITATFLKRNYSDTDLKEWYSEYSRKSK